MYPSYPHDPHQNVLDLATRAVEGDVAHAIEQSGSVTLSCTANTPQSLTVTFTRPHTPNTIPVVIAGLSGAVSGTVKYVTITATDKNFTLTVLTDTTQSLTIGWISKGVAG